MSTITHREITSTRSEWIVPAAEPWGAAHSEVGKAWAEAERAYRAACQIPEDAALSDNAISFRPGDGEILIGFTIERAATGSEVAGR